MWFSSIFGDGSKTKIIKLVKAEGSLIGERNLDGKKIYIYLLRDFFVEVVFRKNETTEVVENVLTFSSLTQLNSHLEKEFRTAF
jgi:hypothetical protein